MNEAQDTRLARAGELGPHLISASDLPANAGLPTQSLALRQASQEVIGGAASGSDLQCMP